MMRTRFVAAALMAAALFVTLRAADPSGRWAATFPTDMGEQSYTFDFVVEGTTLTGTIKGNLTGESKIADGKIEGDTISFVENATFMEMPLRIVYTGRMASADQIDFSRNVADVATEKLVAKRVK
jgi:hypothetical protein